MGRLLFFAVVQVVDSRTVELPLPWKRYMKCYIQVSAGCPEVCVCAGPPSCPPGVSSVPDGCGCCKVCAAQLNQDCQEGRRPCDHHKGLECNYGNDVGRTHGICRAKAEGRSCEYNGRIYQNGENFSAGCKHQCTCIDGAVGCVPLCQSNVPLASTSCPAPQLVKCCLKIDCHKGSSIQPPVYPPYPFIPYPAYPFPKPYPKPFRKLYPYKLKKEKDTLGNELMEHLAAWRQVGDQCAVRLLPGPSVPRSCGMGVSSRVTNDNARCKLIKETRLCNVRPCSSMSVPVKMRNKGRKCSRTHKAPNPTACPTPAAGALVCTDPNYCGVCRDGRCCSPRRTRTASVSFACPDGERFNTAP
ncbi:hypothetical protein KUCAC02_032750 [Chaenocephalus aceratus]|nr:hypothetical protein KUCAC02_032750 [Chaenocephalus aceratus]